MHGFREPWISIERQSVLRERSFVIAVGYMIEGCIVMIFSDLAGSLVGHG